ncbi:MAG: helix-turn-helix transcriptional regulator [Dehalococcoidia bacterium]
MNCPGCGIDNLGESRFCLSCGANLASSSLPTSSSPIEPVTSSTFIGRQREMGALKVALDDTLSGQGRLVMLAGEPGIGKTRTAQELATTSQALGFQVHWGRCYEGEGAPPYWPWVQPLRSYVQQRDPNQLRSEAGPGAAAIAEIIPDVKGKLSDLEPLPALEPEQARFRLFDSITTFLRNAAQSQPLMLLLEDLHWAHQSSLLLLEFIAQEMQGVPLLLIGTYREVGRGHPLSVSLGNLVRQQGFSAIPLGGLSQDEVRQILETSSGISPSRSLVEEVHGRTDGNPLFVSEITRMLIREGLTDGEQHLIDIPEGVREAIGRRLSGLSPDCNRVLTTASVVGREFGFRLLSALESELTEDQLLQVMDEALEAHLVEEVPGTAERYQFSHSLIQETLASELPAARMVRLHAHTGEALEKLYEDQVDAHASELAYHFSQAEPVLGTERLAHYSLLAGERALATYAYEEALGHFERGLRAKQVALAGAEPATDNETATLWFGMGRAYGSTGQHLDAWTALSRAFDYYEEAGDTAMAVVVAEHPLFFVPGLERPTHMVERALTMVPSESPEAGRLLSRYGLLVNLETRDYGRAKEAFERALAIAEREKDPVLEMRTLVASIDADWYQLRPGEALEKSLRAIDLARRANDTQNEVWPRFIASYELVSIGNAEGAKEHARKVLALAEQLRNQGFLLSALRANVAVGRLTGAWESVRGYTDRGLDVAPRYSPLLASRALVEYETGDFDQGEAYLQKLLDIMRQTRPEPNMDYSAVAIVIPRVAGFTDMFNRLDIAKEVADTVLSSAPSPMFSRVARASLGLLAVLRGDAAAAREQYDVLESLQSLIAPTSGMAKDHLLGLLSNTMGNLEQAMAHFEDALAFCGKAGYRPELAWTSCDYAEALLQRNAPSDREKAISLLNESLTISKELGMLPLVERVAAIQDRVKSLPAKAPVYPDGLSQREVEVLRLVALGKTNPEIAEELIISLNTVNRHVSNIFAKIDVVNRAQASTYANRNRLIE